MPQRDPDSLHGLAASPGVAWGVAFVLDRRTLQSPAYHVATHAVAAELVRFEEAVSGALRALHALRDRLIAEGEQEHTPILDAHALMMQDPLLREGTRRRIQEQQQCAEWALRGTVREIKRRFDELGDDYFRERRSDIDFVGERILAAMTSEGEPRWDILPDDAILVAHDLSPAEVLALDKSRVRGIVTEVGGFTSHTAILARALDIPAVLACAGAVEVVGRGDALVVDGERGEVHLRPSPEVRARFQGIARQQRVQEARLQSEEQLPSTTLDGHRIALMANIEFESEVQGVVAHGAAGIGLYRTEFLFLGDRPLPDEAQHELAYRQVLEALPAGSPVYLRTFDLGSDKLAEKLKLPLETNPALGLRGCRLALAQEPVLRTQLRAMLRATREGRGSILFPMISDVQDLRRMRALLEEEMERLAAAGEPVWREVPVGVMVELPSAVWVADHLAAECDFFSVGTNDLIQYSLAIDRGNEHVARYYHPLHVSHLRALRHVVETGHAAGIPVGLCGEMAADLRCLPISLGLGFDSLSMPLPAFARIKWALRRLRKRDADALLADCLQCRLAEEVEARVDRAMREWVPSLFGDPGPVDDPAPWGDAARLRDPGALPAP